MQPGHTSHPPPVIFRSAGLCRGLPESYLEGGWAAFLDISLSIRSGPATGSWLVPRCSRRYSNGDLPLTLKLRR